MRSKSGSETATGHLIGGIYFSPEDAMTYVVLRTATLWECAPDAAVQVRWANGNETTRTRPGGGDVLVGTDLGAVG
jgi:hypothetical protein